MTNAQAKVMEFANLDKDMGLDEFQGSRWNWSSTIGLRRYKYSIVYV